MRKTDGWRPRASRKRGFDDDEPFGGPPFPLPLPMARSDGDRSSAPSAGDRDVGAVVKWFNPEKGFGFVELSDGSGDAFLHGSVLSRVGASVVNPGAKLRVQVGPGQKGLQVKTVMEITDDGPATPQRAAPATAEQFNPGPAERLRGTVKWYNTEKGFGFIAADSGGKDVFVHASVLRRAGLTELAEGQAVEMEVVQGKKGPEASAINGV
jgi:CspA family cold shock protein